ncbi:MAG: bifunctional hydroxymethylpyrimidine kinase/phosphomethylpyrimidine kinase [Bacteroidales bacterium]|nr:bifunctional hydroxymethylpyrimidine kinase/phosphomethylpyrimidine kinase [Bacteroidales bacterium]
MKIVVISYPENFKHEHEILIRLFEEGLEYFHLRKHNFSMSKLERFIEKIPKEYRDRIIIYDHFELVETMRLKGMHFNSKTRHKIGNYSYMKCHKSFSAHSLEEIKTFEHDMDYFLLSPVFDSISKNGYQQKISPEQIHSFLEAEKLPYPIIALGGINEFNVATLQDTGISGIALLGNIWSHYLENKNIDSAIAKFREIRRKVSSFRPKVLSIAGFDPSSGAGITSDIKTMEHHEVYGLGVCSAITFQNENIFEGVDWLCAGKIKQQIDILAKNHSFDVVKFGIIENLDCLKDIILHLKKINPKIQIIWDPVVGASAGFTFHESINNYVLFEVLRQIYLITPNITESKLLFGTSDPYNIQKLVNEFDLCSVLLKGGHSQNNADDFLILKEDVVKIQGTQFQDVSKHGTGCVLSASIASNLSKMINLRTSCRNGKKYTEKFIESNNLLLGFHYCYDK